MDLEVSASTSFGARIAILSQLLGALVSLLPSRG